MLKKKKTDLKIVKKREAVKKEYEDFAKINKTKSALKILQFQSMASEAKKAEQESALDEKRRKQLLKKFNDSDDFEDGSSSDSHGQHVNVFIKPSEEKK